MIFLTHFRRLVTHRAIERSIPLDVTLAASPDWV
jgi:hypothetical protein